MRISRRTLVASAVSGLAFPHMAMADVWDPPMPDREWHIPVRGGRLYVRANGDLADRRAPVILIHGGPGASHAYLLAALQLASDRAVILYDQLDSGLSDHPGDPRNWTVERFASELDAIRAALDIQRFHLVGHSWGSALAIEHAARCPPGLVSLTLGSPFVSARSWVASLRSQAATLPQSMRNAILLHDAGKPVDDRHYRDAISTFNRRFVVRHTEPAYVTVYRQRIGVVDNARLGETMFGPGDIAVTGRLRDYDAEPLLSRIGAPTLVLCGQYDEMTPAIAQRLSHRVPNRRLGTIPDAGHLTPLDQPDLFVAALRTHLRQADA